MDGWVKLHRKLLDNPIANKDPDHLAVWAYILLNATHSERPVVFDGKKIMLQPGQLITGRKSISEKMTVSESKVQRVLKSFEIEQQIEQQTGTKNRVITVLSWHEYQDREQQNEQRVNNKRTTTEQQLNTNKKERIKESKNERKKEDKTLYAPNVALTVVEYSNLCDKHSKEIIDECISYLSLYKIEKGYKTKSDNLTIQRWVIDAVKKNRDKVIPLKPQQQSNYQRTTSELQRIRAEAEEELRREQGRNYDAY